MEEDICKVIDMDNLPEHIAIIMDGNRRWAKANKLTTAQGHKEGAENLKRISMLSIHEIIMISKKEIRLKLIKWLRLRENKFDSKKPND